MMAPRSLPLIAVMAVWCSFASSACKNGSIDSVTVGLTKSKDKEPKTQAKDNSKEKANKKGVEQEEIEAKALDDEGALSYLREQCGSCHGKGQDLHSTWPMPGDDQLDLDHLESMPSIADAYQALVNKLTSANIGQRPSPMPPSPLKGEERDTLEGLIYWFQIKMPAVVKEAEDTYGTSKQFGSTVAVNMNFRCQTRASSEAYLYRLYNDALGRTPNTAEIDVLVPEQERSEPVSDARIKSLSEHIIDGEGKSEFMAYGLRLFAQRVGGAGSIRPNPNFGISETVVKDLQEEFYQLLKLRFDSLAYKDILLLDRVMVTSNTFAFYNSPDAPCADPGAALWGECVLSAKRSNFFGTLGFLRGTPSSFLASNNNYKRGGEIHAIMRGERLAAQTDGPKGEEANPIPDCIVTNDYRVVMNDPEDASKGHAPRGALAVPRSGAVCQGCHLQKYLYAASFVFRQFDENGLLFSAMHLNPDDVNNPYRDQVMAATAKGTLNLKDAAFTGTAVDPATLTSLLTEQDSGTSQCITDRTGSKEVARVQNVGDLVRYMVGDGMVLVKGLARFIPSALSNVSVTNQEIITAMSRGFAQGDGRLGPVFKAYFQSESFACSMGEQP